MDSAAHKEKSELTTAICASINDTTVCGRRGSGSALATLQAFALNNTSVDFSPVDVAYEFTTNVTNPYLNGFCLALSLLSCAAVTVMIIPFMHVSPRYEQLCLGSVFTTVIFWTIGAIWTETDVTAALQLIPAASGGALQVSRGTRASAMSWCAVGCWP